jgi:hypothetical protein
MAAMAATTAAIQGNSERFLAGGTAGGGSSVLFSS